MVLLYPGSRGWVELVSPDPLLAPHFHPNHPDDTRRTGGR